MKDKEILNSKNTDILKQIPKSWHDIDWKKAGKEVAILQEKIVIAGQYKKHKEIYKWQWALINSFSGRALAVRKTINNSGGKTPGVDGIVWKGPKEYMKAIYDLGDLIRNSKEYKAEVLKRVGFIYLKVIIRQEIKDL